MQTIRAEGKDEHGDLRFRLPGPLVRFRLLEPMPNLRWLVPLPRHMHAAYGPDPNGWRRESSIDDESVIRLFVPRRYRLVCRFRGHEIDAIVVADVEV